MSAAAWLQAQGIPVAPWQARQIERLERMRMVEREWWDMTLWEGMTPVPARDGRRRMVSDAWAFHTDAMGLVVCKTVWHRFALEYRHTHGPVSRALDPITFWHVMRAEHCRVQDDAARSWNGAQQELYVTLVVDGTPWYMAAELVEVVGL